MWYTGPILFRITAILALAALLPGTAAADDRRAAIENREKWRCFADAMALRPLVAPHGCVGLDVSSTSGGGIYGARVGLFDRFELGVRGGIHDLQSGASVAVRIIDGPRANALSFRISAGFPDVPLVGGGFEYRARVSDELSFRIPPAQVFVYRQDGRTEVELAPPIAFGLQPTGALFLETQLQPVVYLPRDGEYEVALVDQLYSRSTVWYTLAFNDIGVGVDVDLLDVRGYRRYWVMARSNWQLF